MKLYIDEGRPGPRLYLNEPGAGYTLMLKSDNVTPENIRKVRALYLETMKANPHRDPSMGEFIAGGGGAAKGKGQKDLSEDVRSLMDKPAGSELEKKS